MDPRWPHEQVAARVHDDWQHGLLAAGSELTVKGLAAEHAVAVGTAHRAITLLRQWGVLHVNNGCRSIVLPCPTAETPQVEAPQPEQDVDEPRSRPAASDPSTPCHLTLKLVQLGIPIRTMSTQADPTDFATLHKLTLNAIRRAGGDRDSAGDYEMTVHLPGRDEPITTVVIAA